MPRDPAHTPGPLVLTFTEGVSLLDWKRTGMLEREWALYQALRPDFERIILVTWGGAADTEIAAELGAELICNDTSLPNQQYMEKAAAQVASLLRRTPAALVKTNQMPGGELAIAITRELREAGIAAPLIARAGYPLSRFAAWEHGSASRVAVRASEREGQLCRAADLIVGTTRQMVEDLCWRHAIELSRTAVIPNYVLTDQIAPPTLCRTPRKNDPLEILFAGRLVPQKRVDRLLDAVALLPTDLRNRATVAIIGEGPEEPRLRELASRLNVRAIFEPRIEHRKLLARMVAANAYCQTSDFEGHPKTILEAMACSCPVVATEVPGIRDVVKDARTGLLAETDPRSIAQSLELVLRSHGLAHALGQAAAAWVREECSLARVLPLERAAHRQAWSLSAAPAGSAPAGAALQSSASARPGSPGNR